MSTPTRIARINASGADFVIVSLGAKQGARPGSSATPRLLEAPLLCHLGRSGQFRCRHGGTGAAPGCSRLGLEWLWRIKEEPALWRRYARDGIRFFAMIVTCVLPLALSRRRADPRLGSTLQRNEGDQGTLAVLLRGRWCRDDLAPLRACLAEALAGQARIVIDLGDVVAIDAAFVGLLLIAAGSFGSGGMAIVAPSSDLRRRFRRHGAEFLLAPARGSR